jgi:uncharacterized protein (DUF608 family)
MSDSFKRRQFLKLSAATSLSGVFLPGRIRSEEEIGSIYQNLIPARKELDAGWALSLAKRGAPRDTGIAATDKADLSRIGMTVGGIGCGTVYLSGDGRLDVWDIFHQPHQGVVAQQVEVPAGLQNISHATKKVRESDGANYLSPPTPDTHPNPFRQGFELALDGEPKARALDASGWSEVKFTGRWPLGVVEYSDGACPVAVRLEAWTPFIPLSTLDSSMPVTVMEYTLENRSDQPVTGSLAGIWENPVYCHSRRRKPLQAASRIVREKGWVMLVHEPTADETAVRPDILFEDFERAGYGDWTAEGTAFGSGPVEQKRMPSYQGRVAAEGERLINSHASAPGTGDVEKDRPTGTLTSREFTIERKFVRLLLGGGKQPGKTGIEVVVDGEVIASATGDDQNRLSWKVIDLAAHQGKKARLRLIDRATGGWGNVGADHIVFTDIEGVNGAPGDRGTAVLAVAGDKVLGDEGLGRLAVPIVLPPSGKLTIRFVLAWHFPNLRELEGVGKMEPQYTTRFPDAAAVARDVAGRFKILRDGTMGWVATWNDTTLPQWLMDRAILTTNTLQTTNCHVLGKEGRFWAWEGVGCCAGTCAHVWHYAQGVARLFPDLERNLREITDFGVAMKDDGGIRFRAEANNMMAIDSQAGVILRTWREHLVSTNKEFLARVWPGAKRALDWLIRFDGDGRGGLDGLLDGKQHNTLDAEWYGKVHCLCSLYLAALRAGQEMAREMGDAEYAATCAKIHAMGAEKIGTLFNGEFFTQEEDPAHSTAIGVGQGCYIDQVIGQWWATLDELGRIQDAASVRAALNSLWRYNFVPEIGSFRKVFKQGRFYAMPGEAGLVMCTWPKGGLREDFKKHWQYAYFNECMTGFEWQAAAHMVQEGAAINAADYQKISGLLDNTADPRALTARGLAVGRAIHDRYAPSRRNPYNEIECSDHYARANASYSLFLAACGFSYNGPAGVIGFDPKIGPENFKAPFTAAEGWGTFEQTMTPENAWSARLRIARGNLVVKEIRLRWLSTEARVRLGGKVIPALGGAGFMRLDEALILIGPGEDLVIEGTA